MIKHCTNCGTSFTCSSGEDGACWCTRMPAVMPLDFDRDCECPDCLARHIGDRIAHLDACTRVQDMIRLAAGWQGGELSEHIDYEIEDGKYVFSRWFHLKRGTCCGNGCRNCPYEHEAVPPR